MARLLKKRPITDSTHRLFEAVASAASDPIPYYPVSTRATIQALLERIEKRDPFDAKIVKAATQWLAALELLKSAGDKDVLSEAERAFLAILAFPKKDRFQHLPMIVTYQRDWLVSYLKDKNYPIHARNPNHQWLWLDQHGENIFRHLSSIPCFCAYESSFHVIKRAEFEKSRQPGELQFLILSHLHNSTPGYVKRLLSSSSDPRS